ncbi:ankyrin repeat domain-containing protein [Streptomyces virginiae]|uniref:ankyrin repeat domain-containing protein n=1 Tax=Streptomyces virginiae TaxID=1961 RepID=UPI000A62CCF5|nr:ankyrin repeat domain-containing protein [Streptomyces virginiae]
MEFLTRVDGTESISVYVDEDDLVLYSEYQDGGRTFDETSRISINNFLAKGPGPWPWYDLGKKRAALLSIIKALNHPTPTWMRPLPDEMLDLFSRAARGDVSVRDLILSGITPDPVDPCGASPLWYAVRSLSITVPVTLIEAGAATGRRIELCAQGESFTTILHETVRSGNIAAVKLALNMHTDPSCRDSLGATPMHAVTKEHDASSAEIVRLLASSGASPNSPNSHGIVPIEQAARNIMPATAAALVDLGADPQIGLTSAISGWVINSRYLGYRAGQMANLVEILRAGGAEVTPEHISRARRAGHDVVLAALQSS